MADAGHRRAWRRRVADYIVRQVDHTGFARFVGTEVEGQVVVPAHLILKVEACETA